MHGQGQPHLRVRVYGEDAPLGRPEAWAVGDALAYLWVRVAGQQCHHVGEQAGVFRDRRSLALGCGSGEDVVHDGSAHHWTRVQDELGLFGYGRGPVVAAPPGDQLLGFAGVQHLGRLLDGLGHRGLR
ncbi:hypothetical protein [Streptomyces sp. CBMA152]|uniref:hypothetical protein n=1 Tax=Streptomyces sp. CBMA152 TaxID=1896312 RepID=UPI00166013D9|nr:hypothetical protein [Streptomyces sp. CBMA152]MBD0741482.1 hypothetical protein [Streptomyces sp. CBMA152]